MSEGNQGMTDKFTRFVFELEKLCKDHQVQLATSGYDGLQVWDLKAGERAIHVPDIEDKTNE